MLGSTITLGRNTSAQRTFRVVPAGTLAQDVWMMNAVRRAGLDALSIGNDAKDMDATALDAFLTSVVTKVFQADVVAEVLAACLVEDTAKPNLKTAAAWQAYMTETRDLVSVVEDPEEKRQLLQLLSHVIAGFLSSGRSS